MFPLPKLARVFTRRPPTDVIVRDVATRSLAAVLNRLSRCADNMSEAELRGYVRARAARPVRLAAEQLATDEGWRDALSGALVETALERTVHLIVYRMRMQPVAAAAAVRATLRAAG